MSQARILKREQPSPKRAQDSAAPRKKIKQELEPQTHTVFDHQTID